MIDSVPLKQFKPLAEGLLRPVYADYSFANIPATIHYLLTGERLGALLPESCFGGAYPNPSRIVLFFIDSFGWKFWQEHQNRFQTTRRVAEQGVVTPISALFPSTTAASVATLSYGVLPSQHALYEWNIYIPEYGEVIQTLPFMPLGRHRGDACLAKGYDPAHLVAVRETAQQRLARHGVRTLQFANSSYANSAYSKLAFAGTGLIQHDTLAEALVQLKEALAQVSGKALFSFYWGAIDHVAHRYGPGTAHHKAEIESFWQTFDHVFSGAGSHDTLYLFTADHGQVRGDARATIYINERIPGFAEFLPISPTGNLIYPNGGPRDVFLHIKPERRTEALDLLRRHLGDDALVLPMEAAIDEGLFGPEPPGAEFRRRIGDILVLPYPGKFVWWREPGLLANSFHGHHGGLAAEELITLIGAVDTL